VDQRAALGGYPRVTAHPGRYDASLLMPHSTSRIDTPPTPRERQILAHLARGEGYKQTAEALGISRGTVSKHMHRLCAHTDSYNLAGVLFALGWTHVPDEAAA
jgi:DNA-binding NarL/FixJ family response regulator